MKSLFFSYRIFAKIPTRHMNINKKPSILQFSFPSIGSSPSSFLMKPYKNNKKENRKNTIKSFVLNNIVFFPFFFNNKLQVTLLIVICECFYRYK